MKIRKHICILLLSTCLSQSLVMGATAVDTQPTNNNPDNTASKDDLNAQKELFQLQLDAKKELLQKDIEAQSKRIDSFEKRIDDQINRISDIGSAVDRFGVLISLFSVFITIVIFLGGLLGYKTAKSDAKQTAEEVASRWFEDNNKKLNSRLEELEKRAAQASKRIDVHEDKVAQRSSSAHAEIEALTEKAKIQMENLQRQILQSTTEGKSENKLPKDSSAIEQKAEQLKQKPESEYKFADWNTRAFSAYSEGKFEDAIFYWDKAISSPDIQPHTEAQTMLNKGLALGNLNRNEEAITAYEAVTVQFGSAEELSLRELAAGAMYNKGFTLGQLNRSKEEIATYDEVIAKFGTEEESNFREIVKNALINKRHTLNQLNLNEEEIAVYDEMISQFGASEEPSFRQQAGIAWNGKGFSLLCKAKANWEKATLAQELLVNANEACISALSKISDYGFAHGNLAYINWLQGNAAAAEQHFRSGLSSTMDGGENLYKGTLSDFEIHPIAPDQGFRELVERLWAEYQQFSRI